MGAVLEFGENKATNDDTGAKKKALKELKFLDDKQAQNLSKRPLDLDLYL